MEVSDAVGSGSSTGIRVEVGWVVAVKAGVGVTTVAVGCAAVSVGAAVSGACPGVTAGGAAQAHNASTTAVLNSMWTGFILFTTFPNQSYHNVHSSYK